jgi:2-polyprenyl-3-methyl-5-hydroxy-6-metoxy-1,4-benzoquinol methylase
MKCRLCNYSPIKELFSIEKACPNISSLLEKPKQLKSINLSIYKCDKCNFIQLSDDAPKIDYDNYFMAVSYSENMKDCQREQVSNLIELSEPSSTPITLLEIGCGDGGFIKILKETNKFDITGIEPSVRFYNHSKQIHNKIHNIYLSDYKEKITYDVIVAREVLEHIADFKSFLSKTVSLLKEEGLLMIQVPRIETMYNKNRFHMFFTDHVNYFSEETLTLALQLSGLSVMKIEENLDGEFTTVYARKISSILFRPSSYDWSDKHQDWKENLSKLKDFIENSIKENKKIALWGAGGKGISAITFMNLSPNDNLTLIDCDPEKIGRYTLVSNFLIQDSKTILESQIDIVIILAEAYTEEIIKKLHSFNYTKQVICLSERLK